MLEDAGAVRRQLEAEARRYEARAEDAETTALREYYRGRAAGARNAASAVHRLEASEGELDPTDVIASHSDSE